MGLEAFCVHKPEAFFIFCHPFHNGEFLLVYVFNIPNMYKCIRESICVAKNLYFKIYIQSVSSKYTFNYIYGNV